MNTDDEERVCLRSEEERSMDDKLVCDEVHLRTLSQSPLALQRQQQRRQSNQSTQSTTKTSTPLQRRRCSGGNAITISNEFELPRPPLAQHELLDDDDDVDPKCQRVSVKNSMLDITDNGDSGVGADDETDCGLSNPAAQTEDSDGVVIAEAHNEDLIDASILRVKQLPDMSKIPRLPGDGAHSVDDQRTANSYPSAAPTKASAVNSNRPTTDIDRVRAIKNAPLRVQSVRIVEQRMKLEPKRRTESCSIFGNMSNYGKILNTDESPTRSHIAISAMPCNATT